MDNPALFHVRTESVERVKAAMEQHKLPKDSVGAYKYNNAHQFALRVASRGLSTATRYTALWPVATVACSAPRPGGARAPP